MDVRLPKLGEGADAGTVVNLFVKEGDELKQGQTILELENEKAVAPIPSPADGKIVKIRVKEGDKISVGQLILTVDSGTGTAASSAEAPVRAKTAPAAEEEQEDRAPEPSAEETPVLSESRATAAAPAASPSIRKLARDLGIDLSRVRGSERGGRIVLGDLHAYIQHLQKLAFPAKLVKTKSALETIDFSKWGNVTRKPLTSLRQTIAQRMVESWTSIPRVTQFDEADITALMDLRKKHNPSYEQKGARLTLTPFVLKGVAAVLKKFPIFNASIDEAANEVVYKEYFHLGLAVDTEAGLIVPVLRDVDKKSMLDLAREVNALAEKARDRKISLEELKGGSFTISNQGGIGGGHFTPIINKPEVAILGLGRGVMKAVVRDGKIEPRLMLPLALSYDHRLIDGGQAARFITELVQHLERFEESAVKL